MLFLSYLCVRFENIESSKCWILDHFVKFKRFEVVFFFTYIVHVHNSSKRTNSLSLKMLKNGKERGLKASICVREIESGVRQTLMCTCYNILVSKNGMRYQHIFFVYEFIQIFQRTGHLSRMATTQCCTYSKISVDMDGFFFRLEFYVK